MRPSFFRPRSAAEAAASYWLFEAVIPIRVRFLQPRRPTFASIRSVLACAAVAIERRKRKNGGNERVFPPKLGCGRNWRRYCCCYRIFLPI